MGVLRDYGWGYVAACAGLALVLVVGSAVLPDTGGDVAGGDVAGGGVAGGAGAPAARIPPGQVVAGLQVAGGAYPQALRAAMAAERAAPGDLALAQAAARALISEGRARGDSRLVGAAVGVLRPYLSLPAPGSETLYLAATARQYQHDFPGALALLDQALAGRGEDINALLSRATILTVRGDYPAARKDCRQISRLRADIGFLCQATTEILTAEGAGYAARLQAILAQPGVLDDGLRGWATGLVAEIALHRGDTKGAVAGFAAVIAADPLALRERLLLADLQLLAGQPRAAVDLLAPAPETDGVLIRRVLGARALGDAVLAARLAAVLDQRFRLNLDLGLVAHAREEALYFLKIAGDPVQALARAQVNWALQHEIEDAVLLLAAAKAAGQPEAGQPVRDWMAQNAVLLPAGAANE